VALWTANFDANKQVGKGEIFYGLEAIANKVASTGNSEHINTGAVQPVASRYPDGSTWNSFGGYGSYRINFHPKFTFNTGLRYNYARVQAVFSNTFFPFPYQKADIKDGAFTGNLGLVFRPAQSWQLNANISTGFRVPNIDDIGKLFESTPGNLTVPNPALQSEYAWNFELGFVKTIPSKLRVELNGFYTLLDNAIVRRPFTLNGQDSVMYDGSFSRVEALQNAGKATVFGLQALVEIWTSRWLSLYTMANYITGKETDDIKNEQVPLRHAPPFYGSTGIRYFKRAFSAEANIQYNSEISYENLAPSEQAKPTIYAKDALGRPFSPAWYCINAKASYHYRLATLTLAWENMTNQQYRTYSSGIVAPGSNFIVSLRVGLQ
jgi:hemoglobin/transferrin/lactoferrin receptor protein